MQVNFHPISDNPPPLIYVVICARYQNQWLFVRHRERTTWEIPGGHIEDSETPDAAAARELFEETGALNFTVHPVCDYSVTANGQTGWGRLYLAEVTMLGELPVSEIAEVISAVEMPADMTYPQIQPLLLARVIEEQLF